MWNVMPVALDTPLFGMPLKYNMLVFLRWLENTLQHLDEIGIVK